LRERIMAEIFEPNIVAFLCNWCSYAGADMAGISRIQYRPNIRVIRVMCSGRVDPVFIFEALLSGFDGVLVLGCHPGDCHYLVGNYQAEKVMNRVSKLMEIAGISKERLFLD
jgi:F420-non-reducing hydrogenase iron-sulfur subunit